MTVDVRPDEVSSRARTPARVAPTRIGAVGKAVGGTTTTSVGWVAGLLARYSATEDAWDAAPSSPREVLEYTRSGDWVPGEQAAWLEWLGKVYGYTVALPVTVFGFAVVWTVQRPSRAALVGVIAALGWFASGLLR